MNLLREVRTKWTAESPTAFLLHKDDGEVGGQQAQRLQKKISREQNVFRCWLFIAWTITALLCPKPTSCSYLTWKKQFNWGV